MSVGIALRLLAHLDQGPAGAFSVLVLGGFLAFPYARYRVISPLVAAHIAVDLTALGSVDAN